ncbi:uncharacterized protein BO96DRAFT_433959 [Aspergillus niger CBS 101883]|uniref:uncharacterized protein n=1 Tax=Aspergillus lacticoffeatus (strain CBS 101883) TaxID=1450533 RepID=UPI000D7EEDB3|nr:uncharacterized protein BO96DRAFT_433959 [Aspergillus niger CBS 101883]PYH56551.1 hypothetical protein BO96DRAFT_433959 [Aspergillus niger CBS 101883]
MNNTLLISCSLLPKKDFPELITAQWKTFENHLHGIFRLLFSIEDGDLEKESPEKYRELARISHQRAADDQKERIAAAAKWYFFDNASFLANHPPVEVDWHSEGVTRSLVAQAVQQHEQPRHEMVQGPHAYLPIGFTGPESQRQGFGSKWLEWRLGEADRLGLEIKLDATDPGVPLYGKYNFQVVKTHELRLVMPVNLTRSEVEEWKRCEEEFVPIRGTVMVRFSSGVPAESMVVKGN